MLDPETHDLFTRATVTFLLEARAQFLATGASALTHWSQMTTRLQLTPQCCASVEEMTTTYLRKLRVEAPSRGCSSAILMLRRVVSDHGGDAAWLAFVERESAFLIASAREEAELRKAARDATHLVPIQRPTTDPDPDAIAAVEETIRAHQEEMS